MVQHVFEVDRLRVEVHGDEDALGAAAAVRAAAVIREAVEARGRARVILATGNSQFALVRHLVEQPVPWSQVEVFHMDEYLGMGPAHPASFQRWIRERVVDRVHPGRVHYIDGLAPSAEECARYEALLREAPIDLTCMGIGENGHLAFNEPLDSDPADPAWVRVVELTERSRLQQVGEGHFPSLEDVPARALSLTVPALLSAGAVLVSVPEERKAAAVRATLEGPVGAAVPSTWLRAAGNATLLLEPASASALSASPARS